MSKIYDAFFFILEIIENSNLGMTFAYSYPFFTDLTLIGMSSENKKKYSSLAPLT